MAEGADTATEIAVGVAESGTRSSSDSADRRPSISERHVVRRLVVRAFARRARLCAIHAWKMILRRCPNRRKRIPCPSPEARTLRLLPPVCPSQPGYQQL